MTSPETLLYQKRLMNLPPVSKLRPRIVRYFANTSMRLGHPGLAKLADKNGIDVNSLPWGEFVVFMNKAQSSLKMYAAGNALVHLRMPARHRIDPRTIALLPRFFTGKEIQYDRALEEIIHKEFGTRRK